jgi:3'-5' exoribonuclease
VRDLARQRGDVNAELLLLLDHVLLAPLPAVEGGGRGGPLVPEALIVQHAVDLDVKLAMVARALERDLSPGPFTERDPALGRQLLKGRSV